MSFFTTLTEDGSYALTGAGYGAVLVLIIILVIAACFITSSPEDTVKTGTRRLIFAAMAMALAFVTSFIKILQMPMGGSVTLFSMFFITLIGYWYGLRTGLTAAFAYGLMQFVADPYILSIPQVICDYLLAFGAMGISGIFHNSNHGMIKGYLAGVCGRLFFSCLSGIIFFADYAPEGMNPALYSFLYNGAYIFTEAGLTVIIVLVPAVSKALNNVKILALNGTAEA